MDKKSFLNESSEYKKLGEAVLNTTWDPNDYGIISAQKYVDGDQYLSWKTKTVTFLKLFLDNNSDYVKTIESLRDNTPTNVKSIMQMLDDICDLVEKDLIILNRVIQKGSEDLDNLLDRFHIIARQLRDRYDGRPTLDVEDEYDVQDLLAALLRLLYDDVRAEEWTPSYAGKSARVDFLLKNEEIVIEVKKTRRGLADRELGDQLLVDIARYSSHPNCKHLVCFVYDPEGRIGNPSGIIRDLEEKYKGFVHVVIKP